MLEYLVIFGKGGAILWTFGQLFTAKGNPVDTLIQKCLLEDRGGGNSYAYKPPSGTQYTMKWTLHNGLNLVFVAMHQQMLSLPYVEELLEMMKEEFAKQYEPSRLDYDFDNTYKRLLDRCQKRAMEAKTRSHTSKLPQSTNGKSQPRNTQSVSATIQGSENEDEDGDAVAKPAAIIVANGFVDAPGKKLSTAANASSEDDAAFDRAALSKKFSKLGKAGGRKVPNKPAKKQPDKKQARKWDDTPEKGQLDFSKHASGTESDADGYHSGGYTSDALENPIASTAPHSRMDVVEEVSYEDDDREIAAELTGAAPKKGGLLSGFIASIQTSIVGKEALTRTDIQPAIDAMQKRLQERNVSASVSSALCDSVANGLDGRKLASFTGVSAIVRSGFEDAITRILSPKRSVDVLAEIRAMQAKGKPYSMVFVGVNGVGKSTNLAKIAYWLRQQKLRVMIAACDTFRSGAVEQLKTHCNRLGVPLYDRGYDKDPTNVAMEAIRQAERDGIDVVLVDTAGRMQDNEPLMHALSTLINRNNPNLVLFVGEALVGNDGVNQLVKFNQRLADLSPPGREPRLIDGIIVTKFDAIDDKVGAVLSMAYSSGAPIMFVGCGQTYVDLMRLNVKAVVKSLLK